jgi:hypothetical protein
MDVRSKGEEIRLTIGCESFNERGAYGRMESARDFSFSIEERGGESTGDLWRRVTKQVGGGNSVTWRCQPRVEVDDELGFRRQCTISRCVCWISGNSFLKVLFLFEVSD